MSHKHIGKKQVSSQPLAVPKKLPKTFPAFSAFLVLLSTFFFCMNLWFSSHGLPETLFTALLLVIMRSALPLVLAVLGGVLAYSGGPAPFSFVHYYRNLAFSFLLLVPALLLLIPGYLPEDISGIYTLGDCLAYMLEAWRSSGLETLVPLILILLLFPYLFTVSSTISTSWLRPALLIFFCFTTLCWLPSLSGVSSSMLSSIGSFSASCTCFLAGWYWGIEPPKEELQKASRSRQELFLLILLSALSLAIMTLGLINFEPESAAFVDYSLITSDSSFMMLFSWGFYLILSRSFHWLLKHYTQLAERTRLPQSISIPAIALSAWVTILLFPLPLKTELLGAQLSTLIRNFAPLALLYGCIIFFLFWTIRFLISLVRSLLRSRQLKKSCEALRNDTADEKTASQTPSSQSSLGHLRSGMKLRSGQHRFAFQQGFSSQFAFSSWGDALLSAALIAAGMILVYLNLSVISEAGTAVFAETAFGLVLLVFFSLFHYRTPAAVGQLLRAGLFFLLPALCMYFVELSCGNYAFSLKSGAMLANYVGYLVLLLILCAVTGKISRGSMLLLILSVAIGFANTYVIRFRDQPILPSDLYSLSTAASVASEYDYSLSADMVRTLIGALAAAAWIRRLPKARWHWYCQLPSLLCAGLATLAVLTYIGNDGLTDLGIKRDLWTQTNGYKRNGFLAAFAENATDFSVKPGSGYQKSEAAEKLASYPETDGDATVSPTILVIMNEAFYDLEAMAEEGQLSTNQEALPFFHSWTDNVVKGTMLVSTFAGGTARTEFEFLTGSSMAFHSLDSMPYQQYIHQDTPSLTSWLSELGYDTIAYHPYLPTGWERDKVYPWLGFDQFLSRGDMDITKLRIYCSDQSDYENLLQILDEHDAASDRPLFLFNVTMQNHSSYTKTYDNFVQEVSDSHYDDATVNQYLSLLLESDRALEHLITELEEREEPIIVCFFGDHAPKLTTSVFKRIVGGNTDDEVWNVKSHTVPFFLWSNYELETPALTTTSANYLALELLKYAGLPLNSWYSFLETMEEELPAFSGYLYQDDDTIRSITEEDLEADPLNEYRNEAYYYIYDQS